MKCLCNNCSGEILFEEGQEGQTVACLHCELDTVLYRKIETPLSSPASEEPTSPKKTSRAVDKRVNELLNKPSIELPNIVGAGSIIIVLVFVFAGLINHNSGPGLELGAGILGFTLAVVSLVFAIIWIVFPLVVYFQLVWRDISHWTVIEKINANRDCTLGLLMVSPAQRVGAYV